MRQVQYLLQEAANNVRTNRTTTLIAVATTAFTLSCFGVFLLLYLNLRELTGALEQDFQVIVYLTDEASPQETAELRRRLEVQAEVSALVFVSKEQALADFREQFPAEQRFLEGLGDNPLPASFVITLAPPYRSSAAVKRWAERVRGLPGVDQVQYSQDWIENLTTIARYVELGAIAFGAILAAASVTIIASTIRLALYARRDEIEILRLVGTTGTFIKVPYLLEGAALGLLGGLLSLLVLRGGFEFYRMQLGTAGRLLGMDAGLGFFAAELSITLVALGLVLGSLGSYVSLAQFGRVRG